MDKMVPFLADKAERVKIAMIRPRLVMTGKKRLNGVFQDLFKNLWWGGIDWSRSQASGRKREIGESGKCSHFEVKSASLRGALYTNSTSGRRGQWWL